MGTAKTDRSSVRKRKRKSWVLLGKLEPNLHGAKVSCCTQLYPSPFCTFHILFHFVAVTY